MARIENLLDLKGHWPRELWPLFCTTPIPVETINKFLLASEEGSKRTPGINRDNLWNLILTHSQPRADEATSAPIPESHISMTFADATLDDLGHYCRQRFSSEEGKPKAEPPIASDRFGVIDERSLRDDTIVLVRWELWDERIDPKSEDDSDEAFRRVEGWATVRVQFHKAPLAVGAVGEEFRICDYRDNLDDEDDGVCLLDGR